ncbi:serine hydroxymethyltransferase, partial [Glutamicibacter soli]
TPALATRGFSEEAFAEVAEIIAQTLIAGAEGNTGVLPELKARVLELAAAHPLYPELAKVSE